MESSVLYSRNALDKMNLKTLQGLAEYYQIAKSGNKAFLIERIIPHQERIKRKRDKWNRIMAHGGAKRDEAFEHVILVFQEWTNENGFWPIKQSECGLIQEWVHINEIRAAFSDYDPKKSPLRSSINPMPRTKIEVFLEMLFLKRHIWEMMDKTYQDRVFDFYPNDNYKTNWMGKGMYDMCYPSARL